MNARGYEQFCPLALALDRIGERWTLLIVRELAAGPARFSELSQALPGLATNLLTKRLRGLEEQGLVRQRTLPPPARVKAYELTEQGATLEPVLRALATWGAQFIPQTPFKEPANLRGMLLMLRLSVPQAACQGERARLQIRVDEHALGIVLDDAALRTQLGELPEPDATLTLPFRTLFGLLSGQQTAQSALDEGSARLEGDPAAVAALDRVLARAHGRHD